MKTLGVLMEEASISNKSGSPQYVLDAINRDIAEILYSDDKDILIQIQVKNRFYPFAGKSEQEIRSIISQGLTTKYNQVLYVHFNQIFEMIGNDGRYKDFYTKYNYTKQKLVIDEYVKVISAQIDTEQKAMLDLKATYQTDDL